MRTSPLFSQPMAVQCVPAHARKLSVVAFTIQREDGAGEGTSAGPLVTFVLSAVAGRGIFPGTGNSSEKQARETSIKKVKVKYFFNGLPHWFNHHGGEQLRLRHLRLSVAKFDCCRFQAINGTRC